MLSLAAEPGESALLHFNGPAGLLTGFLAAGPSPRRPQRAVARVVERGLPLPLGRAQGEEGCSLERCSQGGTGDAVRV